MNKKVAIGLLAGIGVGALLSLRGSPISLPDLLSMPLASIWGSPGLLGTGILEVSENIEPVQEATRRLFKPLGSVHLIRRYPPVTPSEAPPPAPETPAPTNH